MHWEISALNRLYKTNVFAGIKHRVVQNQFVFVPTSDIRFDLQLKNMETSLARSKYNIPELDAIIERFKIPPDFVKFAAEKRVVDFFSPYYMCDAVNRISLTSLEETKGQKEEKKKKKTKVDSIETSGEVPSQILEWERIIAEMSVSAANLKNPQSTVNFKRHFLILLRKIDEHLSLRTVIMGHLVSYLDILAMGVLIRFEGKIPSEKELGLKNIMRWKTWITQLLNIEQVLTHFSPQNFKHMQRHQSDEIRLMKLKNQSSPEVIDAALKNDLPRLKALIESDPIRHNVDSHNIECDLMTPLHIACDARNLEMVRYLVEGAKADLESFDKWDETPIFYAVTMGALDICKYLKDKGANINHQESMGRTPLYWAASSGEAQVMRFLMKEGATPNLKNSIGRSALSKAAWNSSVECVEILLSYPGIEIDVRDENKRTPLHNACWGPEGGRTGKKSALIAQDSPECTRVLLSHGAGIELKDEKGNTALSIAASTHADKCVAVLLQFGASVTTVNKRNSNPIHKSTKRGYFQITKMLIEAGSPLDHKDNRALTCLDYLFVFNQRDLLVQLFSDPILQSVFSFDSNNLKRCFECTVQNGAKRSLQFLLQQIFNSVIIFNGGLPEQAEILSSLMNKAFIFKRDYQFFLFIFQQIDVFRGLSNYVNSALLQRALIFGNGTLFQTLYSNFNSSLLKPLQQAQALMALLKVAIVCRRSEELIIIVSALEPLIPVIGEHVLTSLLCETQDVTKIEEDEYPAQIYIPDVRDGKAQLKRDLLSELWKKKIKSKHLLLLILEYYREALPFFFNQENKSSFFSPSLLQDMNIVTAALKLKCEMEEVLILLRAHPNPRTLLELTDEYGMTPREYCAARKRWDILQLIKQYVEVAQEEKQPDSNCELLDLHYELEPLPEQEAAKFISKATDLYAKLDPAKQFPIVPIGEMRDEVSLAKTEVVWVETEQELIKISAEIKKFSPEVVAVDLEYFGFEKNVILISLLQLSTLEKDYVVDGLTLRRLIKTHLGWLFQAPGILKVLHGCDSDLQLLMTDMDIITVNFFDTAKAYVFMMSECAVKKTHTLFKSLEYLVELFFGVKLDKSFQIADWRIRPLPLAMLQYARCDTHFLIQMYSLLTGLLRGDAQLRQIFSPKLPVLNSFSKGDQLVAQLALQCNKMAVDRYQKNNLIRAHVWVKGKK